MFVATFGWGPPGGMFVSEDGITWNETLSGSTGAGIAFGQDTFLAGDFAPWRSTDAGQTWLQLGWAVDQNARRIHWIPFGAGRFLMITDGDLGLSDDQGTTWDLVPTPTNCAVGASYMFHGGMAYGNDVLAVVHGAGTTCRSLDGGATWTVTGDLGVELSTRLVFDGTEFAILSNGAIHTSPDGASWTTTPTSPSIALDNVQVHDGIWVGVGNAYDQQAWWVSDNGIDWSPASGPQGHPIIEIAAMTP